MAAGGLAASHKDQSKHMTGAGLCQCKQTGHATFLGVIAAVGLAPGQPFELSDARKDLYASLQGHMMSDACLQYAAIFSAKPEASNVMICRCRCSAVYEVKVKAARLPFAQLCLEWSRCSRVERWQSLESLSWCSHAFGGCPVKSLHTDTIA